MSTQNGSTGHGITFLGALQVLFIGLKLTGYIDWPWYGVCAPLLAELAVVLAVLVLIFVADMLNRR